MNTTTTKENTMSTTTRPNRYAGRCNGCGAHVPAGRGVLAGRMVGGSQRWLVRHTVCPSATPAPAPAPVAHVLEVWEVAPVTNEADLDQWAYNMNPTMDYFTEYCRHNATVARTRGLLHLFGWMAAS